MKHFNIKLSGCAPRLYPTDTLFGLLWYGKDEALEIPKRYPYKGEWGEALSDCLMLREDYPMPRKINLVYLSVVERKFYALEETMPDKALGYLWNEFVDDEGIHIFTHIVVGMAPYGLVTIWFYGLKKSIVVGVLTGGEAKVPMEDFMPQNPFMKLEELCEYYIKDDSDISANLKTNGLPPRNLFDKYMQQFNYRYVPRFMHWDDDAEEWLPYEEGERIPEFDYIEEALFDGTHDKLHDGGLMKYHSAGKPKKLAVKWHVKKAQYTAYFWMDEDFIADIFERFYGANTDIPADLALHIDYERSIFDFSLFREGMREPIYISADAYQLIVFKDGFERFRSENYNQPSGAWVW